MLKTPLYFVSLLVQKLFELPFLRSLAQKHPTLFEFIRKRFEMNHFFGLPFTILIAVIAINLAVLSELAEGLVNSSPMQTMDREISMLFFELRTETFTQFMYFYTHLGGGVGQVVMVVVALVVLGLMKKRYYVYGLLVSVIGSRLSVYYTKLFFQRERPLDLSYYLEESYSFPSGHATSAMAISGIIFYFLFLESRSLNWRLFWIIFGGFYVLLMGFSRIYLGVHFLSDVVAGFLLGLLWVLVAVVVMEFLEIKTLKAQARAKMKAG